MHTPLFHSIFIMMFKISLFIMILIYSLFVKEKNQHLVLLRQNKTHLMKLVNLHNAKLKVTFHAVNMPLLLNYY